MEKSFKSELEIGYELNELIPLVARLVEKYTGFESSSVTYECAQQLMEAVIYCIQEYKNNTAKDLKENQKVQMPAKRTDGKEEISAADAYQYGYELVVQKARAANKLYNEIMENFCDYGNRALYETMAVEMPKFFLYYDARFAPQETLILDYPAAHSFENFKGIDKVYQYLCDIQKEQEFLRRFPERYVRESCTAYDKNYGELFINLGEIVYKSLLS